VRPARPDWTHRYSLGGAALGPAMAELGDDGIGELVDEGLDWIGATGHGPRSYLRAPEGANCGRSGSARAGG
jgi:hypothetical protein